MPAVKSLHQESENNSKTSFIMGHSFQVLGLLVHGPIGRYLCKDLLWRPVGQLVRFVLVKHPTRGRMIFMTTLTSLNPLDIIRIYADRSRLPEMKLAG